MTPKVNWEDIPWEAMTPMISRKLFWGKNIMLAKIHLKKNAVVPLHAHEEEQMSYVTRGHVAFTIGENRDSSVELKTGEVLHLPGNVYHEAVAIEESVLFDVFSPPRKDWIGK